MNDGVVYLGKGQLLRDVNGSILGMLPSQCVLEISGLMPINQYNISTEEPRKEIWVTNINLKIEQPINIIRRLDHKTRSALVE